VTGTTTDETADAYLEYVFKRFGAQEILRHDRDPAFMSSVFKRFSRMMKHKQRPTMAYRPQANGKQERNECANRDQGHQVVHRRSRAARLGLVRAATGAGSQYHSEPAASTVKLLFGARMAPSHNAGCVGAPEEWCEERTRRV
jgi:hypothetical protein